MWIRNNRPGGRPTGTDAVQTNHRRLQREVTIINVQGLHARPVMRFVDIAAKFASHIRIRKNEIDVDGKSPMEMMLLEAPCGTVLTLVVEGPDAEAAMEAIVGLVNEKFGEE